MSKTPDDYPGVRIDEGLELTDEGLLASTPGEMRYTSGRFSFYDATIGEYDPAAGSGLSESQHNALRVLVHLADGGSGPMEGFASGAYRESIGGIFPTSITWYETSAKLKKIVDKSYIWTGAFPTTITWKAAMSCAL